MVLSQIGACGSADVPDGQIGARVTMTIDRLSDLRHSVSDVTPARLF